MASTLQRAALAAGCVAALAGAGYLVSRRVLARKAADKDGCGVVTYLVADVGGTNVRVEAYAVTLTPDCSLGGRSASRTGGPCEERRLAHRKYASKDYTSFEKLLEEFTRHEFPVEQPPPSVVVVAVAGPVAANRCQVSNLSWMVDGDEIERHLGVRRCVLVNDFVAVGLGILNLTPADTFSLHDAPAMPHAPIAVVGAGSGLGEGYLTFNGSEYDVWPSEGGHADFAPRNKQELELVEYMSQQIAQGNWRKGVPPVIDAPGAEIKAQPAGELPLGLRVNSTVVRVSVERIVSGTGLPHIYNFLRKQFAQHISKEVDRQISEQKDDGAAEIITRHALAKSDVLCERAVDIFVSAYGSEAGNLALKILPYGGIYVAGGIAPKIISLLKEDDKFWRHLSQKGRLSVELRKMPVFVIKEEVEIGLLGAREKARRVLRDLGFCN
jgi:glucokinase